MRGKEGPPNADSHTGAWQSLGRRFVDRGEEFILAIGANLSLNEAQHVEHQVGNIGASVNRDRFNQAMIELGVDAGLIIVITLALLIIHRYTLQRELARESP